MPGAGGYGDRVDGLFELGSDEMPDRISTALLPYFILTCVRCGNEESILLNKTNCRINEESGRVEYALPDGYVIDDGCLLCPRCAMGRGVKKGAGMKSRRDEAAPDKSGLLEDEDVRDDT